MIQETLVTTINRSGTPHIAPMGIHLMTDEFIMMPFRPSTTLDNLLETQTAVINYCDDVRIFAGCLTGRGDWPLAKAEKIKGHYLTAALAHTEVTLQRVEENPDRPKCFCSMVHRANHAPFQGFNRAQYAVLEAAILVSRINLLPWHKIQSELDYLRIGFEKTAGDREIQAWQWLMNIINKHESEVNLNDRNAG